MRPVPSSERCEQSEAVMNPVSTGNGRGLRTEALEHALADNQPETNASILT